MTNSRYIDEFYFDDGTIFQYDGFTYTLFKVEGDGWQWKDATGHYALTQNCYFEDLPTIKDLQKMAQYLS